MKQPDKLFRDKLEHHTMEAPNGAWGRIEANLPTPHAKTRWVKIAASLLLLALSTFWIIQQRLLDRSQAQVAVRSASTNKPDRPAPASQQSADQEIHPSTTVAVAKKEKRYTPAASATVLKYEKATQTTNTAENEALTFATLPVSTDEVLPPDNQVEASDVTEAAQSPHESLSLIENKPGSTLVFAAAEVDAKYLLNDSDTQATYNDENTSSFRKLLKKASELKNNQNGYGELRQKKNEILALNFRNDKRERND